jgi:hypothetical protein
MVVGDFARDGVVERLARAQAPHAPVAHPILVVCYHLVPIAGVVVTPRIIGIDAVCALDD